MTQQEQSLLAHGLLTLSFPIIVPQDVKMHTYSLLPEHRSSSDQLVQVRCMHGRSTVRSDFWPQIVHSEEEEVLLERRWRLGDRQHRKKQHANEKRKTLGSHDCRGQESSVMVFFPSNGSGFRELVLLSNELCWSPLECQHHLQMRRQVYACCHSHSCLVNVVIWAIPVWS